MRYHLVFIQMRDDGIGCDRLAWRTTATAPLVPQVGQRIWINEEMTSKVGRAAAYRRDPNNPLPGDFYEVTDVVWLYDHQRGAVHQVGIEVTVEPAALDDP